MRIRFIADTAELIRGLAVIVLALLSAIDTSATPPANDNFADRIILQQPPPGGSIMVTGTLNGATVEPNEPIDSGYYSPVGLVAATAVDKTG